MQQVEIIKEAECWAGYTLDQIRKRGRKLKEQGQVKTIKEFFDLAVEIQRKKLHRQRIKPNPAPSLQMRLAERLRRICFEQIDKRRLSQPAGWYQRGQTAAYVKERDPKRRLWLIRSEYLFDYGRKWGKRWICAVYLCGKDDAGYWAARVPATIKTIQEALEWIRPPQVRKALKEGRIVKRQGDIYFVQSNRNVFDALDETRHTIKPHKAGGWIVTHPEHKPLRLSGKIKWRTYQGRNMGWGGSLQPGD